MNVKDAASQLFNELGDIDDVVGVGVGQDSCIVVYLDNEEIVNEIPKKYLGFDVKVEVTGEIKLH